MKTVVCSVLKSPLELSSVGARVLRCCKTWLALNPLTQDVCCQITCFFISPQPSSLLNLSLHLIRLVKPFHYLKALFWCLIPPILILQQAPLFSYTLNFRMECFCSCMTCFCSHRLSLCFVWSLILLFLLQCFRLGFLSLCSPLSASVVISVLLLKAFFGKLSLCH